MNPSVQTRVAAPTVDLVFDPECPNVEEARTLLRAALETVGLGAEWREWKREGADTPRQLRGLGSPTILIDGLDVSGQEPNDGSPRSNCCRVYHDDGRLRGVPPLRDVIAALTRARQGIWGPTST